ncbi:protease inhibitor I9 family protein [Nocardioides sp. J2M5]|uniref:protease inhibitor I9 family protein n=1 Tax=Nocardioides palaemonis TaxID=2829810 RepID=UPI001BAAE481|nr:protease inhibitor I9 family protein [Nocardioides palaemonis]MBS2938676.1 protease inhibitor I9 family protein [Nocardioides palaemonis]
MRNPHRRALAGIATLATAALALTPAATHAEPSTAATAAQQDQAPLVGSASADRFIVVMDEQVTQADVKAAKTDARGDGATVEHTYKTVVDGFVADLTPAALDALRGNPDVARPSAATSSVAPPPTW